MRLLRTGSDLGGCAAAAFISVSAVTLLGQSPSLAPLDSPLYTRGPLMVRYMAEMLALTVRGEGDRAAEGCGHPLRGVGGAVPSLTAKSLSKWGFGEKGLAIPVVVWYASYW